MQATTRAMEQEQENNSVITITFSEHDRVRGVATLMRSAEWFRTINKNQFMIKSKDLGLLESKNIRYNIIK